jgi:eukaryotic-like serine/threonine-protein kinase
MPAPTACPSSAALRRLAHREATPAEEAALFAHVEECPRCFAVLQTISPTVSFHDGFLADALRSRGSEPLPPNVARLVELLKKLGPSAGAPAGTVSGPAEALGDRPGGGEREEVPDIPGFEILSVLGTGSMGVVYKVFDRTLKRFGALKMVRPDRPVRAEALARLRAEAEALARLKHHHIVLVFASGEHDGQPYIVQEFVEEGTLQEKIRGEPQEPREAARLVRLLARAVHAAHSCGIIHRDLKPGNVLLAPLTDEPALNTAYGCPKVADFGLAKCLDSTQELTATGVGVGTPLYMAPEQARGDSGAVGPATDVWALGAIHYEMLTGQVPFRAPSALQTLERIRTEPPKSPRQLQRDVPPELEAICLRCLQKDPGERYQSAAALAEDLSRWLEGRAAPRPPEPDQPRDTFLRRCWPFLVAGLLLAVLGGVVLFVVLKLMSSSP